MYTMQFKLSLALFASSCVNAASASNGQTCWGSSSADPHGQRGSGLLQSQGCPAQRCLPPPAVILLPVQR